MQFKAHVGAKTFRNIKIQSKIIVTFPSIREYAYKICSVLYVFVNFVKLNWYYIVTIGILYLSLLLNSSNDKIYL